MDRRKSILGRVCAVSAGNGAAGDPSSLGVSAVMLGKLDGEYTAAAQETVDALLTYIPRWSNGAISHRPDVAELWYLSISSIVTEY